MRFSTPASLLLSVFLASCQGQLSLAGESASGGGVVPGSAGAGGTGNTTPAAIDATPVPQLRRLTRVQYQNTVTDLFGVSVDVAKLPPDVTPGGFSNIGASQVSTSLSGVAQYEEAARGVAEAVANSDGWAAFVGCTPSAASEPCVSDFLSRILGRAFRRPATSEELARYLGVVQAVTTGLGSVNSGLTYAMLALLQSPSFIYRHEPIEPDAAAPSRGRYGQHTLATRLAYLLTDSGPDARLMTLAEQGQLGTSAALLAEAARLTQAAAAKPALSRFYAEWLSLDRLDNLAKEASLFPAYSPELGLSMRAELELLFSKFAFDESADFMELFDTKRTFVDPLLAGFYRVPTPPAGTFSEVSLPAQSGRAGLLTTAGLLSMNARATMTSPTLRGIFIRTELMCQSIPKPPDGVSTDLPPLPNGVETQRQRLERHRTSPTCAACHALMDPLGLSLEHFDAVGAYRADDLGQPLDVTGDLDGVPFDGALELAGVLRSDPRVQACIARKFSEHALGRSVSDAVAADVALKFQTEKHQFLSLVRAVVTSDAFRYPVN